MVHDKGIAPHVPVWDKSERADGTLGRRDFTFDPVHDRYLCPEGGYLYATGRVTGGDTILYRASKLICERCDLKPACCPHTPARRIPRSIHEDAREVARSMSPTPAYRDSRRHRKKVEMLFAHLKRILKLDRLRLRGLSGAQDAFVLAATVQNLRRTAKKLVLLPGKGDAFAT